MVDSRPLKGAPVLNNDLAVVVIRRSGGQIAEPATQRCYLRNEGVHMSAILDDLRCHAPDDSGGQ